MATDKFERWREKRAKGFARYLFVDGVLSWGLPMFVVMTFVVRRRELEAEIVAICALAWAIGGLVFGAATWWWQERAYRRALRDSA